MKILHNIVLPYVLPINGGFTKCIRVGNELTMFIVI